MAVATIDDPAVVADEVAAFLRRFLESPDGAAAALAASSLDAPAVVELRIAEPGVVLTLDIGARTVVEGPADEPGATVEITARDLNDLLLDRLGPVEISRLVEEERVHLEGPPPALAALLVLAGRLQPHWPASLAERGRDDWLALPAPEIGEIWESAAPPPPVFGVRRPWQRVQTKR